MIAHRSSHKCWKLLKEQVEQKKKNKVKEKKKGQTTILVLNHMRTFNFIVKLLIVSI